jgi:E3 ubiquitin-protein ligase SIAH1
MADGYQRCHAMEDVMDSIRGPCPHAPYGCDTTPVYHAREEHILECPHGDGCSFVGSVTTLVEHLKAAHSWPCTAEAYPGHKFDVKLCDGFNFLTAVRGSTKYLLLLNMASTPPFGRAISVVRLGSLAALGSKSLDPATRNTTSNLRLLIQNYLHNPRGEYYQSSNKFQLECTCPSSGLPDPNASFQFFIPKYVRGSDEATVLISATFFISSS